MILFINGSINSGKSTVAKALKSRIQKSVILEIDDLRRIVDWMPLEEAIPLNFQNASALIRNFALKGIHVIVPYPLSRKNYEQITEALVDLDTDKHFFTLDPGIEKTLSNRGERVLDDWEKDRIKHHYAIGIHKPDFGEIIDASSKTPEQIAYEILEKTK